MRLFPFCACDFGHGFNTTRRRMTIGVSVASHKLYSAFSFSFPYSTLPSRATSQSERVCFLKDFGSLERLLRVSNFPRGAYRVSLSLIGWPEECLKPWPRMSKRTFRNRSGSKKYEIEYLIARNNKTCPIEVRSGSSLRHTPSDESCEKDSDRIADRVIFSTKDYKREGEILSLPISMTSFF